MDWRTETFLFVQNKIKSLELVKFIDLQRGQFLGNKPEFAIPMPCVLINFANMQFKNNGSAVVQGYGAIRLLYYEKLQANFHTNSENKQQALTIFEKIQKLSWSVANSKGELFTINRKTSEKAEHNGSMSVFIIEFEMSVLEFASHF